MKPTKAIVFLLFLLFLAASHAEATIARGVGPFYGSNSPGTSATASTVGLTVGRMLVITIAWDDTGGTRTISSVTVAGNDNATVLAGTKADRLSTNHTQIAILPKITAGGDRNVTVNMDGSTYLAVGVMEYSGQDDVTQPDAQTAATGTSANPSTTLTTITSGAGISALLDTYPDPPTAPGSGYTWWGGTRPNQAFYQKDEDNVDVGAAGSKTVDFAASSSVSWGISAIAIKPAGAAGNKAGGLVNTDPLKSLTGGGLVQ